MADTIRTDVERATLRQYAEMMKGVIDFQQSMAEMANPELASTGEESDSEEAAEILAIFERILNAGTIVLVADGDTVATITVVGD